MKCRVKQLFIIFIIPFVIFIISFIIGGFLPFGTKDIMTANGHESVLPYFYELWDNVHDGRFFFYSTRTGMGYDFSEVITYYLSDPVNLLILIFPRNTILTVLNILFIIKCSISAVFFYLFLEYHIKIISDNYAESGVIRHIVPVSLSVVFSLSGFMLLCGTDITMTSSIMIFPLVILGLEKLFCEGKPVTYMLFFILSVICSFRFSIVLFIFSSLYFFSFKFKNIRHFLVSFAYKIIADVLVIGSASIVICNNISSEFFKNTYSNLFPVYEAVGSFFKSLLNIYNSAFYSGFIVIIMAISFFFIVRNNLWRRLRLAVLLIISYAASYISSFRYLLNGFNDKENDLYALPFVFITIILCFETIINLQKKEKYQRFIIAITIAIAIEVTISGSIGIIRNGKNTVSYFESEVGRIEKCIDYILEKDPYAKIRVTADGIVDTDPVGDMILGYKYIVNTSSAAGFDYIETVEGIDICKSSENLYNGCIVNSDFLKWEPNERYPFSSINQLVKNVWDTEDIYVNAADHVRVVPDFKDKTYKTTSLMYSFDEPGEYYTHLYDKMTYLGYLEPGEEGGATYHVSAEDLRKDILSRETVCFNDSLFNEIKNKLILETQNNSLGFSREKNRFIIHSNNNKPVYIILPFSQSDCFKYFSNDLNDIKTKTLYGSEISVISLDSGNNQIDFQYIPYKLYKGLVLSIVSLILFILGYLMTRKLTLDVSENKTKFELWIYDNRVYIYTLILSTLVYFTIMLINQCVPFGNASAVVSDGFVEDYPTNTKLIQNLRRGALYDVDYILGFQRGGPSISSYMFFMNPLRLVMVLFPAKYSLLGFNTFYALEFILLGQAMLLYLTHRSGKNRMHKCELKLIPIALCYNLSTFALCYYSFAGFLDFALILPFIMLAMDRLIYEGKYIFYTIIMAYYMVIGTYFAFLLCIFLFLYFFTMEHENIKKFVRNGIRFAIFSIIAAGLASFTLISFYSSVTNSGYVESDSASSESINMFSHSMLANLNDLQVMHQISRANDDFTVANTYCGILLIMLIPALIFLKKKSRSSSIRRIILILILYFAYGNELLNYVFHGFHFQSLVPNRFSLFFIFLVIDSFYDVICDYKVLFEKKVLIVYSIFSLSILFISYYCCDGSIRNKIINATFILCYLGVLLAGYIKKNHYHFVKILLFILCVELGISTMHTIKAAFKGSSLLSTHDINSVNELNAQYYGSDDEIVKASMPTQDATNLACIAGFNSVDVFTSSLQQEQIDMSDFWGIEHGPNYLSYDMGNPFADIALKVKGFYLYDGIVPNNIPSYMEKKESLNSVVLYEDGSVPDIGILFPSDIKDVDIKDFDNAFEYQNYLSRLLVGEELYDIIKLTEQPMIDGELEEDFLVDDEQDVELLDDNQPDDTGIDETQQDETENMSDIFDCVISKAGSDVSYRIDRREGMHDIFVAACTRISYAVNVDHIEDDVISTSIQLTKQEAASLERDGFGSISAAMLNKDTLELIKDYLNTKCISNLKADNNGIFGDITVDYDGYVFIPTFMYDGWKTTVDGTEVKTEKILGGTGIPITKGKHTIKISKLNQINMKQYYLSCVTLIIFFIIIIISCVKRRKS